MTDVIDPAHYKQGWSDNAELISITENLTSNGAQAVQYVARSTRLDKTLNKSGTIDGQVEDLNKAIWFIKREIRRLTEGSTQKSRRTGGLINIAPGYSPFSPVNIGPAVCDVMVHNVSSLDDAISIKAPSDKQGKPVVDRELLKRMNEQTVGVSTFNTGKRAKSGG